MGIIFPLKKLRFAFVFMSLGLIFEENLRRFEHNSGTVVHSNNGFNVEEYLFFDMILVFVFVTDVSAKYIVLQIIIIISKLINNPN